MKNFIYGVLVLTAVMVSPVWADGYGGIAFGLGEPCRGVGDTGFTEGDCRNPGILGRVYIGNSLTDYFRLEGTLDALFDPRRLFGLGGNSHVSALTLGVYTLTNLQLTSDVNLFAGPGVGASMVYVSGVSQSYYYNQAEQERYDTSEGDTTYGINYGWTLGVEVESADNSVVRVQWQTWRSMDSDVLYDQTFSMNYLSLSVHKAF